MFRTDDDDIAGVPGMFGEGQTLWHVVSRLLKTHWYHATLQIKEGGCSTELSYMFDTRHELQQMLISQNAHKIVTDVQGFIPSWMTGNKSWKLESLTSVSVGNDEAGCEVFVLEVESGSVYYSSHQPDFHPGLLTNLHPIFLSTMIRAA